MPPAPAGTGKPPQNLVLAGRNPLGILRAYGPGRPAGLGGSAVTDRCECLCVGVGVLWLGHLLPGLFGSPFPSFLLQAGTPQF